MRLKADNEVSAHRAIERHEQSHLGCNERYWYIQAEWAKQAAIHFFRCEQCRYERLCDLGARYARALGLVR